MSKCRFCRFFCPSSTLIRILDFTLTTQIICFLVCLDIRHFWASNSSFKCWRIRRGHKHRLFHTIWKSYNRPTRNHLLVKLSLSIEFVRLWPKSPIPKIFWSIFVIFIIGSSFLDHSSLCTQVIQFHLVFKLTFDIHHFIYTQLASDCFCFMW